jgi:hypothetical protein
MTAASRLRQQATARRQARTQIPSDDGLGESAPAKNAPEVSTEAAKTSDRIDQAAVLGAALAASVSISAADGPWEPMESVVGLVLICLIRTYVEIDAGSTGFHRRKRLAVAGVLGLAWCLVVAWPLQLVMSGLGQDRWTDFLLPIVWIGLVWSQVRRFRGGSRAGATSSDQLQLGGVLGEGDDLDGHVRVER